MSDHDSSYVRKMLTSLASYASHALRFGHGEKAAKTTHDVQDVPNPEPYGDPCAGFTGDDGLQAQTFHQDLGDGEELEVHVYASGEEASEKASETTLGHVDIGKTTLSPLVLSYLQSGSHVAADVITDDDVGLVLDFRHASTNVTKLTIVHDRQLLDFEREAEARGDHEMSDYACSIRLALIRAKSKAGFFSNQARRDGGVRKLAAEAFADRSMDAVAEYDMIKDALTELKDMQVDIDHFAMGRYQSGRSISSNTSEAQAADGKSAVETHVTGGAPQPGERDHDAPFSRPGDECYDC